MVPAFSRGVIGLHTSVLNREHIIEDTLLVHRFPEQPTTITGTSPQLLTSSLHALVLTLQLEFVILTLLRLEELPSTVDGPVTQETVTREAERTRGERVVEEVANEGWLMLAFDLEGFGHVLLANAMADTNTTAGNGFNILIRLSVPGRPARLAIELVDENGADCTAAVIGPACVARRVSVSWQARVTEGRTGASDMGIRKTFARDASAGDRDRIVVGVYGVVEEDVAVQFRANNSLTAELSPPLLAARLNHSTSTSICE